MFCVKSDAKFEKCHVLSSTLNKLGYRWDIFANPKVIFHSDCWLTVPYEIGVKELHTTAWQWHVCLKTALFWEICEKNLTKIVLIQSVCNILQIFRLLYVASDGVQLFWRFGECGWLRTFSNKFSNLKIWPFFHMVQLWSTGRPPRCGGGNFFPNTFLCSWMSAFQRISALVSTVSGSPTN